MEEDKYIFDAAEPEEEVYVPEQPEQSAPGPPQINVLTLETQVDFTSQKDKQEEQYTSILESFGKFYKKKSERNHFFKAVFFFVILLLLLLLVAGFAAACILLAVKKDQDWTVTVPVAAGGTAALLSALIVLPQIIATHLFPTDEDRVIVDLIAVLRGGADGGKGA